MSCGDGADRDGGGCGDAGSDGGIITGPFGAFATGAAELVFSLSVLWSAACSRLNSGTSREGFAGDALGVSASASASSSPSASSCFLLSAFPSSFTYSLSSRPSLSGSDNSWLFVLSPCPEVESGDTGSRHVRGGNRYST